MYEENVLIKLRRDYEKDEVVMFALNKIKAQEVAISKLKDYISKLKNESAEFKEIEELKNKCNEYKDIINKLQVDNKRLTYNRISKDIENKVKEELRKNIKLSKEELKEFGFNKLLKENENLKKEKIKLLKWTERLKATIVELKEK